MNAPPGGKFIFRDIKLFPGRMELCLSLTVGLIGTAADVYIIIWHVKRAVGRRVAKNMHGPITPLNCPPKKSTS